LFLYVFSGTSCNLNALLQAKDLVEAIKVDQNYCLELSNRTVGILGLGTLGLRVARTLRELGTTSILYHDVEPVSKETDVEAEYVGCSELLERSDIICVCSNLEIKGTSNVLFNKAAFKQMKKTAILIDATKGFLANFPDLYDALRTGDIAAAGLDVREYDVIPNRHPLAGLDNCFFLPYRECYKWDWRRKLSADLCKSILSTLQEIEFVKLKRTPQCNMPAILETSPVLLPIET